MINKYHTIKSEAFLKGIVFLKIPLKNAAYIQQTSVDSAWKKSCKKVMRYNLSGSLLFRFDKYTVFGYERIVNPHQSFSVNFDNIELPKLLPINTFSF